MYNCIIICYKMYDSGRALPQPEESCGPCDALQEGETWGVNIDPMYTTIVIIVELKLIG